jgi:hypothetical protein
MIDSDVWGLGAAELVAASRRVVMYRAPREAYSRRMQTSNIQEQRLFSMVTCLGRWRKLKGQLVCLVLALVRWLWFS